MNVVARPTVYSYRSDLLGAVLNNLVCAWIFADKIEANFVACYVPVRDGRPNLELTEILDEANLPFKLGHDRPRRLTKSCDIEIHRTGDHMKRIRRHGVTPAEFRKKKVIWHSLTAPIGAPGQTPEALNAEVAEYCRRLPIHPAVRAAFDAIDARIDLAGRTAIHIRRGDIIRHILSAPIADRSYPIFNDWFFTRFAETEAYARALAGSRLDGDVFIFCEDHDPARDLARLLGDRKVAMVNDFADIFAPLTPTQKDFLEVMLMSRTRGVIGTPSHFSRVAAQLGNVPVIDIRVNMEAKSLLAEIGRVLDGDPEKLQKLAILADSYATLLDRFGDPKAATDLRAIRTTLPDATLPVPA